MNEEVPTKRDEESGGDAKKPLFTDFNADDDEQEASQIESLCVNCEESGTTQLLFTKIPFFKEVILISFEFPHCGNKNNEIQSAGPVQDKGLRITTKVKNQKDMNRRVVKQSSASFRIPELDFESEAFTQKGALTTIEGVIQHAIEGLEQHQKIRRVVDPETAAKIDGFIKKLETYRSGEKEFTLILEDTSGNSFIENPHAPSTDPNTTTEQFTRTKEQNEKLGFYEPEPEPVTDADEKESDTKNDTAESQDLDLKNEVLQFQTNCQNCQSPAATNMKVIQIPHFKEVIIMATNCDACGFRSNEVKSGGGIEPLGTRITLKLTDPTDLSRDVLKSETCDVRIPELDFEMCAGTIGGKFTTVEGLLVNFKEQLQNASPFTIGDSAPSENKKQMDKFIEKLAKVISGESLVTLILDDTVGNSYIQNTYAPEADPEMKIEKYERSFDQNEDLGLNDMETGQQNKQE